MISLPLSFWISNEPLVKLAKCRQDCKTELVARLNCSSNMVQPMTSLILSWQILTSEKKQLMSWLWSCCSSFIYTSSQNHGNFCAKWPFFVCLYETYGVFPETSPWKPPRPRHHCRKCGVYKKLMLSVQVWKETISQNFTNEDPKTQRSLHDPYLGGWNDATWWSFIVIYL